MAEQGWNKIHRSIEEHWLWTCDVFSRGQAWIDLILLVNHKDNKVMVNGTLINVKRGQRITSLRKLSEKWKWSTKKVKHFLKQLKDDNMIDYESDNSKTIITIINYDKYQGKETPSIIENTSFDYIQGNTEETQRKHEGNTEETQRKNKRKQTRMIKNDKNENNEKNEKEEAQTSPSLSFQNDFSKFFYNEFGEISYKTWIADADIKENENKVVISVPNVLTKNTLTDTYIPACKLYLNKDIEIKVKEDMN